MRPCRLYGYVRRIGKSFAPVAPSMAPGRLAGVGRDLSSVAAGHPGGTRSALDRFRETSIVGWRVRGDVPPHPLPSGERLFFIFPR
jgi:hypothetical protein